MKTKHILLSLILLLLVCIAFYLFRFRKEKFTTNDQDQDIVVITQPSTIVDADSDTKLETSSSSTGDSSTVSISSSSDPMGYVMSKLFGSTNPKFNYTIDTLEGETEDSNINLEGNLSTGSANVNGIQQFNYSSNSSESSNPLNITGNINSNQTEISGDVSANVANFNSIKSTESPVTISRLEDNTSLANSKGLQLSSGTTGTDDAFRINNITSEKTDIKKLIGDSSNMIRFLNDKTILEDNLEVAETTYANTVNYKNDLNVSKIESDEVVVKNLANSTNLTGTETDIDLSAESLKTNIIDFKELGVAGDSYFKEIKTPETRVSTISSKNPNKKNVKIHENIAAPAIDATNNIVGKTLTTQTLIAPKYCDLDNNCLDFEILKAEIDSQNDITSIVPHNLHDYVGCFEESSINTGGKIECDSEDCRQTCDVKCDGYSHFGIGTESQKAYCYCANGVNSQSMFNVESCRSNNGYLEGNGNYLALYKRNTYTESDGALYVTSTPVTSGPTTSKKKKKKKEKTPKIAKSVASIVKNPGKSAKSIAKAVAVTAIKSPTNVVSSGLKLSSKALKEIGAKKEAKAVKNASKKVTKAGKNTSKKAKNLMCFRHDTPIKLLNSNKLHPISLLKLGDILENGIEVLGLLELKNTSNFYRIWSKDLNNYIYVTGEHRILKNTNSDDKFENYIFVKDFDQSEATNIIDETVYCLITNNHRIPVGEFMFWDWED